MPFKFRGYEAEDYVLCFFRDRLFRAEVVLRLPKDIPTATFAHWCDEWLTGVEVTNLIADRCEGRENDIGFTAGMTYDTEIAGPLVTLVVYDLPTRELYERRAKTPLP